MNPRVSSNPHSSFSPPHHPPSPIFIHTRTLHQNIHQSTIHPSRSPEIGAHPRAALPPLLLLYSQGRVSQAVAFSLAPAEFWTSSVWGYMWGLNELAKPASGCDGSSVGRCWGGDARDAGRVRVVMRTGVLLTMGYGIMGLVKCPLGPWCV